MICTRMENHMRTFPLALTIALVVVCGCQPPTDQPQQPNTPAWTLYPPLRSAGNLGPVVTDVESHLVAGHPYRDTDRVTWVHEGTHGIAARLRNTHSKPGFYVLQNRAVLMREPPISLSNVAATVPESLRGPSYNIYLVLQQRHFQCQPTYVFDEWVAYTNGAEARLRLGVRERGETVRAMVEFIPYALCVAQASRSQDPQMRAFIRWQVERSITLARQSNAPSDTLSRLRNARDAQSLRQFARVYLGADWTRRVLEF